MLSFAPWNDDYFAHRSAVIGSGISVDSASGSNPFSGVAQESLPDARRLPVTSSDAAVPPIPVPDHDAESRETPILGPDPQILERLLGLFRSAKSEILVNVYLLTESAVVDELIAAKKRGLDVRVILEKDPYKLPGANRKSADRLRSAGVDLFQSRDAFAFVHAKYAVADGTSYVFSTGNYASTSFRKNREYFVFGNDPSMASFLHSLFLADFRGSPFFGPVPGRAYLAPVDARTKIIALVRSSKKTLQVWAPSLSDPELLRELSLASQRGVSVSACLPENSPDIPGIPLEFAVFKTKSPQLHAKTLLSDRSVLWIGSANFTTNSLDRNREVGAVFSDSGTLRNYETTLRQDCKR